MKKEVREFKSGGLRDTDDGKYNYYGFREPKLEQIFAEYMHYHRKMADGTMRDADNWWKGWDKEVSLQSLVRHVEDLQALHVGYLVYEIRRGDGIEKVYVGKDEVVPEGDNVKMINVYDCCSAIRFNSMSYLLNEIDRPTISKSTNY